MTRPVVTILWAIAHAAMTMVNFRQVYRPLYEARAHAFHPCEATQLPPQRRNRKCCRRWPGVPAISSLPEKGRLGAIESCNKQFLGGVDERLP
jgi:hypothetical protein